MKVEVRYAGLCREKTPSGAVRWRVRVEGEKCRKITVPVGPEHKDFRVHYEAARDGRKLEVKQGQKTRRGTLDELRKAFVAWMQDQVKAGKLSRLTLESRERGLRQACDTLAPHKTIRLGELHADLPRQAFVHIADTFGARTGAAATCLKALRAAYTWGADRGFPTRSEVFGVSANHQSGDGAVPWTSGDVEKFLQCHGPGSMARLWFCLAYATAGRIGDAPYLGPKNEVFHDNVRHIDWQPRKKGSKFVSVPMDPMLDNELQLHEPGETYLVTEYGRAFASSGSLDNRVRKWIIEAGLFVEITDEKGKTRKKATRSQHGIRKGVAELLAEGGASTYEIMSVLSHSEPKTTAKYTENVDRRRLAQQAIEKCKKHESVPPPDKRGTPQVISLRKAKRLGSKWQPVGESNPSFQVENLAS